VFHQAALRITRCAEAPREAVEVLIDSTLNVLEAALEHNVNKVIAASSASVYGEPSYLPIDEAHAMATRRYDARDGTVYLLRPDQHVCARWRRADAGIVRAALDRALCRNA